jgi:vacuolar-type H+-ATPase subunit I/STV1
MGDRMLSIVFGLIALSLGFWGLVKYWWYMVDVLIAILPLLLIGGGAIALLAGIRNTGIRTSFKVKNNTAEETETSTRKQDE